MCFLLYPSDGSLVPRKTDCIAHLIASVGFSLAFHFLSSHNRFGFAYVLLRLPILIADTSCYLLFAIVQGAHPFRYSWRSLLTGVLFL